MAPPRQVKVKEKPRKSESWWSWPHPSHKRTCGASQTQAPGLGFCSAGPRPKLNTRYQPPLAGFPVFTETQELNGAQCPWRSEATIPTNFYKVLAVCRDTQNAHLPVSPNSSLRGPWRVSLLPLDSN